MKIYNTINQHIFNCRLIDSNHCSKCVDAFFEIIILKSLSLQVADAPHTNLVLLYFFYLLKLWICGLSQTKVLTNRSSASLRCDKQARVLTSRLEYAGKLAIFCDARFSSSFGIGHNYLLSKHLSEVQINIAAESADL